MKNKRQRKPGSKAKKLGLELAQLLRGGKSPAAQVLAALPMAIFCKDVQNEFRYVYWNQRAEDLTGISNANVMGQTDFELWPEDVAKARQAEDHLAAESRQVLYSPEVKLMHAGGSELWVRSWRVPIFDDAGQVSALIGLKQDITVLKNAERASLEAAHQLNSVVANAPGVFYQLVCTHEKIRKFLFVSRRSEELFGIPDSDLMGDAERLFSLIHLDDRAEFEHSMSASICDLSSWIWEGRIGNEPEQRWIRFVADPELKPDGSIMWDGFASDITLQKQTAESARERFARLANATRMAALGEMAAGLAHELNTPISTIFLTSDLLNSQLSRSHATPDELIDFHQILDTIDVAAGHMSKVIADLRMISQSNSPSRGRPVDLRDLVAQSLTLCAQRLKYLNIEVQVIKPTEPVHAPPETSDVGQVLVNLLNNSIDVLAGAAEAWIRIEIRTDEIGSEVRVINSGEQIRERIVSRLFEPFFTTKDPSVGTGLSLSVSKHIMQQHGGDLIFDKAAPHTTFLLSLPHKAVSAA